VVTTVSLPAYDITVASDALDTVGEVAQRVVDAHRYALITDSNVEPLYAARVCDSFVHAPAVFRIPAGEVHKTRESWSRLTDELLAAGLGRDSCIIALGGGVVGDLAGFVAATFMRGIPFIQVPTTLLAMIDASIGGKTGVDTPAGKNLVGAFHDPAAVVVDPTTLASLPMPELRAGLAEAIKHGVIADAAYFEQLWDDLFTILAARTGAAMHAAIARSIEIKADVVRRDQREHGLRKILNFGHTLGHAIELESGYRLLHGEAVAIGMVLESRLAESISLAATGTAERVRAAVERAGLPVECPTDLDAERLIAATRADKKARAGAAEYALPAGIGTMAGESRGWAVPVDDAAVLTVLGRGSERETGAGGRG
jgi:3-dehydroquinate synthase